MKKVLPIYYIDLDDNKVIHKDNIRLFGDIVPAVGDSVSFDDTNNSYTVKSKYFNYLDKYISIVVEANN